MLGEPEFRPFSTIERWGKGGHPMRITQKIHGSNAQILVMHDGSVFAGSRTRWLSRGSDNYGFYAWVSENANEIAAKLGRGRHYGEWAGPGINNGEGLAERTFVYFNAYHKGELPARVVRVPELYLGPLDQTQVEAAMARLKSEGSLLVPGWMRPEGIVIECLGVRRKYTFANEDVPWQGGSSTQPKERAPQPDFSEFLQPLRLEKLLSRDEQYRLQFPQSLPKLADDYIADLRTDHSVVESDVPALRTAVFRFLKAHL